MNSAIAVPPTSAPGIQDTEAQTALQQLADAWTTQSNGELHISCVEGSVLDALASLNIGEARLSLLTASEALAWLTWQAQMVVLTEEDAVTLLVAMRHGGLSLHLLKAPHAGHLPPTIYKRWLHHCSGFGGMQTKHKRDGTCSMCASPGARSLVGVHAYRLGLTAKARPV